MRNAKKVLWVKFGWSEYYRGGPVQGNFGWLKDHKGGGKGGRAPEAFNFQPCPNGTYHVHVPHVGGKAVPSSESPEGWTVVCLARRPGRKGIHIVGWYEDATLHGEYIVPNPVAAAAGDHEFGYTISSRSAWFVPPEKRTAPFSHTSVCSSSYSYLRAPGKRPDEKKIEVFNILKQRLGVLRKIAIHNPPPETAPDPYADPDMARDFGTPEHRQAVEKAAEEAVIAFYAKDGFQATRVGNLKLGYDIALKKGDEVLHVEVKGTSSMSDRFYFTKREHDYSGNSRWRFALVTDALSKRPKVNVYDLSEFKSAFDLHPYVYIGLPKA